VVVSPSPVRRPKAAKMDVAPDGIGGLPPARGSNPNRREGVQEDKGKVPGDPWPPRRESNPAGRYLRRIALSSILGHLFPAASWGG